MKIFALFVVSMVIGLLLLSSHEVKGSITGPEKCSKDDISVEQGSSGTLPNGIPSFLVRITNTNAQVSIANIHLSCGEFSSVLLVLPEIFKRIAVDDCLVNDGRALAPGETLSFKYANTKLYPLAVVSITC